MVMKRKGEVAGLLSVFGDERRPLAVVLEEALQLVIPGEREQVIGCRCLWRKDGLFSVHEGKTASSVFVKERPPPVGVREELQPRCCSYWKHGLPMSGF